jgi:hypothetical protein
MSCWRDERIVGASGRYALAALRWVGRGARHDQRPTSEAGAAGWHNAGPGSSAEASGAIGLDATGNSENAEVLDIIPARALCSFSCNDIQK